VQPLWVDKRGAPTLWQVTKIAPYWKGRLIEFFCMGIPEYGLRFQVPLKPKTLQRWYRILRETIYIEQMKELSVLSVEIETWRETYNTVMPHSSLNNLPPYEFIKDQTIPL